MLVLLPPSEGKSAPVAGPALDLAALSLPALKPARRTVLSSLVSLCRSAPADALEVLGLSAGQTSEVQRNKGLRKAPTAPAWQVYTGVLFTALDVEGADEPTRARLAEWTLVWSGLWGAVRLTDPIPAYRLSGAVTLPGPGRLAAFWREPLRKALARPAADGLVVDLRSGTYAASWNGPPERTALIRVIHEQHDRRTVASHFNKATKGRLLRSLAESGATPQSVDELVDALRSVGFWWGSASSRWPDLPVGEASSRARWTSWSTPSEPNSKEPVAAAPGNRVNPADSPPPDLRQGVPCLSPATERETVMGIGWKRDDDHSATVVATSRWAETAERLSERFQRFNALPLDEAVDAAFMGTPGNMSRDELTRRMAASREARPA